jgi:hypothetical protein
VADACGTALLPIVPGNEDADPFNREGSNAMRSSMLYAAIAACALVAPFVSAQEKAAPVGSAMAVDMDQQMSRMQDNMTRMQQQMEELRATTDPVKRQKLMQEHMQTMQESMKAMGGTSGPMMKGDGRGGGMAMGGPYNMAAGDIDQRQQLMERRMDMMQMMMAQMMQHDQMMQPVPTR